MAKEFITSGKLFEALKAQFPKDCVDIVDVDGRLEVVICSRRFDKLGARLREEWMERVMESAGIEGDVQARVVFYLSSPGELK